MKKIKKDNKKFVGNMFINKIKKNSQFKKNYTYKNNLIKNKITKIN